MSAPKPRISSLRPPPPPRRTTMPPVSPRPPGFEAVFDEGSLAHAFDALMWDEDSPAMPGQHQVDLAPVKELFAELAANHMRHVRDFMMDVKWGEATREWVEVCIPAVTSLCRAAERLELLDLVEALDKYELVLEGVGLAGESKLIDGPVKERLIEAYDKLAEVLPQAFALDNDRTAREAVIVQSLLLQLPDVRKVTIDKLHAAGLTRLDVLFVAKPSEISDTTGIPEAVAKRIVDRFAEYRTEMQNASPSDARAAERDRLATLAAQLREQHDGYEEASKGWSDSAKAKKRELFRAREETWLQVSLLLARFGEVDRLKGIEKVPFAARITQLESWLEEAQSLYR
ncbi:MAG: hypothetical protein KC657_26715 [Myxococcales bacterium]|nr:hypothetical protein [Myxococcales bacterium]